MEQVKKECSLMEEAIKLWFDNGSKEDEIDPVLHAIYEGLKNNINMIVLANTEKDALEVVELAEQRNFVQIFTDPEEIRVCDEKLAQEVPLQSSMVYCLNNDNVSGLMINPWGRHLKLEKEIIFDLLSAITPPSEDEQYLIDGTEAYTHHNYEEAFRLYSKAAEGGKGNALSTLADCYYFGVGVERDEDKAYEYWHKAAILGQPNAICRIADLYRDDTSEAGRAFLRQSYTHALSLIADKPMPKGFSNVLLRVVQYCSDCFDRKLCIEMIDQCIAELQVLAEANVGDTAEMLEEAKAAKNSF